MNFTSRYRRTERDTRIGPTARTKGRPAGRPQSITLQPLEAAVLDHDMWRVYEIRRDEEAEFLAWARGIFGDDFPAVKHVVTGAYPKYYVEHEETAPLADHDMEGEIA